MLIQRRLPATGLLLALTICWLACAREAEAPAQDCSGLDPSQNTYTLQLKAVLDANCALAGCHNVSPAPGVVRLSDYAGAREAFEQRDALCSIRHETGSGCSPMPQGSVKLSDEVIQRFACWVENGYRE